MYSKGVPYSMIGPTPKTIYSKLSVGDSSDAPLLVTGRVLPRDRFGGLLGNTRYNSNLDKEHHRSDMLIPILFGATLCTTQEYILRSEYQCTSRY